MNRLKRLQRFLSSVIIVTFFVTNTLTPAPIAHAQGVESPSFTSAFKIPEAFGKVSEIIPAAPASPVLIHIQEAHANYDAQKNIRNILQHLSKNYGVKLILMEGAGNKLTPEIFNFFPQDAKLQQAANDKLMQAGELTGAEVFLIDGLANNAKRGIGNEAEAYGVENAKAYREGHDAYLKVYEGRKITESFLQDFYLQWQKTADRSLGKNLREFLGRGVDFEEARLPLQDWIAFLKGVAARDLKVDLDDVLEQKDWPVLVRYFRLKKIGSQIDLAKVEKEKQEFLRDIQKLGTRSSSLGKALQDVEAVFERARKSTLPVYETRFVFERLMSALPENFSFETYPALRLYIQQLILLSEIQSESLHQEIGALSQKIAAELAKTEAEKKMVELLQGYRLLKKLFTLELNREEYLQVKSWGISPAKLLKGLQAEDRRSEVQDKGLKVQGATLEVLFGTAMSFYETAIAREDFMMQNALRRMKETKQTQAVLITGGFHTEGFKKKILDAGSSYISITPAIGEIPADAKKNYLTAFLGSEAISKSQQAPIRRCELRFLPEVFPQDWLRRFAREIVDVSETVRQVSGADISVVRQNLIAAATGSAGRSEERVVTREWPEFPDAVAVRAFLGTHKERFNEREQALLLHRIRFKGGDFWRTEIVVEKLGMTHTSVSRAEGKVFSKARYLLERNSKLKNLEAATLQDIVDEIRYWQGESYPAALLASVIKNAEISDLKALCQKKRNEIEDYRNFGAKTLSVLEEALYTYGRHLGSEEVDQSRALQSQAAERTEPQRAPAEASEGVSPSVIGATTESIALALCQRIQAKIQVWEKLENISLWKEALVFLSGMPLELVRQLLTLRETSFEVSHPSRQRLTALRASLEELAQPRSEARRAASVKDDWKTSLYKLLEEPAFRALVLGPQSSLKASHKIILQHRSPFRPEDFLDYAAIGKLIQRSNGKPGGLAAATVQFYEPFAINRAWTVHRSLVEKEEAASRRIAELLQKLGIDLKGGKVLGINQQVCPWNDALVLAKVQLSRGVHHQEISVLYDRSEPGNEKHIYSEENHMILYGWGPEFKPETKRLVFRTYTDEKRTIYVDRPIQDKNLDAVFGVQASTGRSEEREVVTPVEGAQAQSAQDAFPWIKKVLISDRNAGNEALNRLILQICPAAQVTIVDMNNGVDELWRAWEMDSFDLVLASFDFARDPVQWRAAVERGIVRNNDQTPVVLWSSNLNNPSVRTALDQMIGEGVIAGALEKPKFAQLDPKGGGLVFPLTDKHTQTLRTILTDWTRAEARQEMTFADYAVKPEAGMTLQGLVARNFIRGGNPELQKIDLKKVLILKVEFKTIMDIPEAFRKDHGIKDEDTREKRFKITRAGQAIPLSELDKRMQDLFGTSDAFLFQGVEWDTEATETADVPAQVSQTPAAGEKKKLLLPRSPVTRLGAKPVFHLKTHAPAATPAARSESREWLSWAEAMAKNPILRQAQEAFDASGAAAVSNKIHWDNILGDFEASKAKDALEPKVLAYTRRFLASLPQGKDSSIFEVGMGIGRTLDVFQSEGYTNFSGIDIAARAVEVVRGKYGEDAQAPRFFSGDFAEFTSSEKYDGVFSSDVFLYLSPADQFKALQAAKNMLRPDGKLFVRWAPGKNTVLFKPNGATYGTATGWVFTVTPEYLTKLLEAAGFEMTVPVEPINVLINVATNPKPQDYLLAFAHPSMGLDGLGRKIEGQIQTAEGALSRKGEFLRVFRNFWRGDFLFASPQDPFRLGKALLEAADRTDHRERRAITAGVITLIGAGIVFRLLAELPRIPGILLLATCAVTLGLLVYLSNSSTGYLQTEARRLVTLSRIADKIVGKKKVDTASVKNKVPADQPRSEMRAVDDSESGTKNDKKTQMASSLAASGNPAGSSTVPQVRDASKRGIRWILIVEDDEDQLVLIKRALKRLNFPNVRVLVASTASRAIKILERIGRNIDAAIFDYNLQAGTSLVIMAAMVKLGLRIPAVIHTYGPPELIQWILGQVGDQAAAVIQKEPSYAETIAAVKVIEAFLMKKDSLPPPSVRSESRKDSRFEDAMGSYLDRYAKFAGEDHRRQGMDESEEALGGYDEALAIFNDVTSDVERDIVAKMMAYGHGYAFQGWKEITQDQKNDMLAGWKSVGIEIPEKLKQDTELFNRGMLGMIRAMGFWWPVLATLQYLAPQVKAMPFSASVFSLTLSMAASFGLLRLSDISTARAAAKKQAAKEAAFPVAAQPGAEGDSKRPEARASDRSESREIDKPAILLRGVESLLTPYLGKRKESTGYDLGFRVTGPTEVVSDASTAMVTSLLRGLFRDKKIKFERLNPLPAELAKDWAVSAPSRRPKRDLVTIVAPEFKDLKNMVHVARQLVSPQGLIVVSLAKLDMHSFLEDGGFRGVNSAGDISNVLADFRLIHLMPRKKRFQDPLAELVFEMVMPGWPVNSGEGAFVFIYSPKGTDALLGSSGADRSESRLVVPKETSPGLVSEKVLWSFSREDIGDSKGPISEFLTAKGVKSKKLRGTFVTVKPRQKKIPYTIIIDKSPARQGFWMVDGLSKQVGANGIEDLEWIKISSQKKRAAVNSRAEFRDVLTLLVMMYAVVGAFVLFQRLVLTPYRYQHKWLPDYLLYRDALGKLDLAKGQDRQVLLALRHILRTRELSSGEIKEKHYRERYGAWARALGEVADSASIKRVLESLVLRDISKRDPLGTVYFTAEDLKYIPLIEQILNILEAGDRELGLSVRLDKEARRWVIKMQGKEVYFEAGEEIPAAAPAQHGYKTFPSIKNVLVADSEAGNKALAQLVKEVAPNATVTPAEISDHNRAAFWKALDKRAYDFVLVNMDVAAGPEWREWTTATLAASSAGQATPPTFLLTSYPQGSAVQQRVEEGLIAGVIEKPKTVILDQLGKPFYRLSGKQTQALSDLLSTRFRSEVRQSPEVETIKYKLAEGHNGDEVKGIVRRSLEEGDGYAALTIAELVKQWMASELPGSALYNSSAWLNEQMQPWKKKLAEVKTSRTDALFVASALEAALVIEKARDPRSGENRLKDLYQEFSSEGFSADVAVMLTLAFVFAGSQSIPERKKSVLRGYRQFLAQGYSETEAALATVRTLTNHSGPFLRGEHGILSVFRPKDAGDRLSSLLATAFFGQRKGPFMRRDILDHYTDLRSQGNEDVPAAALTILWTVLGAQAVEKEKEKLDALADHFSGLKAALQSGRSEMREETETLNYGEEFAFGNGEFRLKAGTTYTKGPYIDLRSQNKKVSVKGKVLSQEYQGFDLLPGTSITVTRSPGEEPVDISLVAAVGGLLTVKIQLPEGMVIHHLDHGYSEVRRGFTPQTIPRDVVAEDEGLELAEERSESRVLEDARSWAERFVYILLGYTVVTRQLEAGLSRDVLERLKKKYGKNSAGLVAATTVTGGLGALMHDLFPSWQKNFGKPKKKLIDAFAVNVIYDEIKGQAYAKDLPEEVTSGKKTLGDCLREVLTEDESLRMSFFPEPGDEFRSKADEAIGRVDHALATEIDLIQNPEERERKRNEYLLYRRRLQQAREASDHEIKIKIHPTETSVGGMVNFYVEAHYVADDGTKVQIFDEVYPDAPLGYPNLWRDLQMGTYRKISELLTLKLQEQGVAKKKILFVDNEVFVSLPTPLLPDAIHHHMNHSVYAPTIYRPDEASLEILGYSRAMRPYIVRNGTISIVDAVGMTYDLITGVALYEHTPAVTGGVVPGYADVVDSYNEDGLRSTNGVLLEQWQSPLLRGLLNVYKKKIGLDEEADDRDFFDLIDPKPKRIRGEDDPLTGKPTYTTLVPLQDPRNASLVAEFKEKTDVIKAYLAGNLMLWLKEDQNKPLWFDKAMKSYQEKFGLSAVDGAQVVKDLHDRIQKALENEAEWESIFADPKVQALRHEFLERPIVSNVRRQVNYKGPDKWIEVLKALKADPARLAAYRKTAARVMIGGREFGVEAHVLFVEIQDLIRELKLEDQFVTIENYNIEVAPTIFWGVSGTVMLTYEVLEASATSMMKGLVNGAILVGVSGGAEPELFTIAETATGREIDIFKEHVTYEELVENIDNGTWKITNGFLVKYSKTPDGKFKLNTIVDGEIQQVNARPPSADSLIDALVSLNSAFQVPSNRLALQWEALRSSPKVDMEKSQARAHMKLWERTILKVEKIKALLENSKLSPASALKLLSNSAANDGGFTWRNNSPNPLEIAPAGILAFVESSRQIRTHNADGYRSVAYHATRGDIFKRIFHYLDQFKEEIPELYQEMMSLKEQADKTPYLLEKVKINLAALRLLDRFVVALSGSILQGYVSSKSKDYEVLLKNDLFRQNLDFYLEAHGKRLGSLNKKLVGFAVEEDGEKYIVAINLGEPKYPGTDGGEPKAWGQFYGQKEFEWLTGQSDPESGMTYQILDAITGEVYGMGEDRKPYPYSILAQGALPVGVPALDIQILKLRATGEIQPEEKKVQLGSFMLDALHALVSGNPSEQLRQQKPMAYWLKKTIIYLQHYKPEELKPRLQTVSGIGRDKALTIFGSEGIRPVMAFIAGVLPELLEDMKDWDPEVYEALKGVMQDPDMKDLFEKGEVSFSDSSRDTAIVITRTLKEESDGLGQKHHVVIPIHFSKFPYNKDEGKVWFGIGSIANLGLQPSMIYQTKDWILKTVYERKHTLSSLMKEGWRVGISVIKRKDPAGIQQPGWRFQILQMVPVGVNRSELTNGALDHKQNVPDGSDRAEMRRGSEEDVPQLSILALVIFAVAGVWLAAVDLVRAFHRRAVVVAMLAENLPKEQLEQLILVYSSPTLWNGNQESYQPLMETLSNVFSENSIPVVYREDGRLSLWRAGGVSTLRKALASAEYQKRLMNRFIDSGIRLIGSFGAPGSGKGTLLGWWVKKLNKELAARGITSQYKILTVSDFLKPVLQTKFPEEYAKMKSGKLVDDSIVIAVINSVLAQEEYAQAYGIIFDGFPRNNVQRARLGELLWRDKSVIQDMNVIVDAPEKVLFKRMVDRAKTEWEKSETIRADSTKAVFPQPDGTLKIDLVAFREVYNTRMKDYKLGTSPMIEAIRKEEASRTVAIRNATGIPETRKHFLENLSDFLAKRAEMRSPAPISSEPVVQPSARDLAFQKLKTLREGAKIQSPASGSPQPTSAVGPVKKQLELLKPSRTHVRAERHVVFMNPFGLHNTPLVVLSRLNGAARAQLQITVGITRADNGHHSAFEDRLRALGLEVINNTELIVVAESFADAAYPGEDAALQGVLDIFAKALQDSRFQEGSDGSVNYFDQIDALKTRYLAPVRAESRSELSLVSAAGVPLMPMDAEKFFGHNQAQGGGSRADSMKLTETVMVGIIPLLAHTLNAVQAVIALLPASLAQKASNVWTQLRFAAARKMLGIKTLQAGDAFLLGREFALGHGFLAAVRTILGDAPVAVIARDASDRAFIEQFNAGLAEDKRIIIASETDLLGVMAALRKQVKTERMNLKALLYGAETLKDQLSDITVQRILPQMFRRFLNLAGAGVSQMVNAMQAQYQATSQSA